MNKVILLVILLFALWAIQEAVQGAFKRQAFEDTCYKDSARWAAQDSALRRAGGDWNLIDMDDHP